MAFAKRSTVVRARRHRRTMSLPEVLLWRELRNSGLKFRRQHPVGDWVVDFYCAAAKTAIAVDGIVHDMGRQAARDHKKAEFLQSKGIALLRISAKDVLADCGVAAEEIVRACTRKN